jgi:hypothetical protein
VEGGIEVSVEVRLDLKDSEEECPACRLPMLIASLSALTYLASYVTAPSVLPAEVAHPLVPIAKLTRSSSPSTMLPEDLSDVLGVSLSEVSE